MPLADAPGESGLRKEKEDPRHTATEIGSHELRRQAYFSCRLCGREQKSPVNTGRNASEKVTREAYFRVSYASGANLREESVNLREGGVNLKTAVDFNAESQRCRVMQRKSEVLRGNGKYKNFSDRVNLHQLGVACMVLQK